MTVLKQMAHGAFWSLASRVGNQGVSLLVFMLVARLIGPNDYGLANFCFIFFSVANLILLGLPDGIISLQITDTRRLSTLFWLSLTAGLILCLALFLTAPLISRLVEEPRIESLLHWFSLICPCAAVFVIPFKLISAALQFKKIAILMSAASLVSGVTGVLFAFTGFGPYAIVAQQLSLNLVLATGVWLCTSWRPSFSFDFASLKPSLAPGLKFMATTSLSLAEEQSPRFIIGWVLGSLVLGYFGLVNRIACAASDILLESPFLVLYPALSRLREDRAGQAAILGQVIMMAGFFAFPLLAFAILMAPVYIPRLFGDAWRPAISVLEVFLLGIAVGPILITIREALRAHNRMGSYIKIQSVTAIVNLLLIAALAHYGLLAVSIAMTVLNFCKIPLFVMLFERWTKISLVNPLMQLWKPIAATILMILAIIYCQGQLFSPANTWLTIIFSALIGGCTYLLCSAILLWRKLATLLRGLSLLSSSPLAEPKA